jgi:4-hydroxybenzoate polyprenyltransferase
MLLELIRFSHTVFALPFALLSAVLAWQDTAFRWHDLLGILLCMVFARSAAMAFNRIADQDVDTLNLRTAQRHLPTGKLSVGLVGLFTVLCAGGFIGSTLLFLLSDNPWPVYLSVPVLLFVLGYSYAKRFTALAHFWLGASLMLAPLAAWIAIRGPVGLATPGILGLAVLFWVAGFDIIYGCQDVEFDRTAGLHSVPARLGVRTSLLVAAACHLVMVGLLISLMAVCPHLGLTYLVGITVVAALLLYEHWLVRPDDLSRVNQAFFYVNGIISVGLLAVILLQVTLKV